MKKYWNSVKDKLPENCEQVLIFCKINNASGHSRDLYDIGRYLSNIEMWATNELPFPTHWRILPISPEEEERAINSMLPQE